LKIYKIITKSNSDKGFGFVVRFIYQLYRNGLCLKYVF